MNRGASDTHLSTEKVDHISLGKQSFHSRLVELRLPREHLEDRITLVAMTSSYDIDTG